jgi:hypothetical protein
MIVRHTQLLKLQIDRRGKMIDRQTHLQKEQIDRHMNMKERQTQNNKGAFFLFLSPYKLQILVKDLAPFSFLLSLLF